MNKNNGNKKVYIRPEDLLELILDKMQYNWKTVEDIEKNIEQMLGYFKSEKFGKLQSEFGL